jgi:hypothetical protein
MYLPHYSRLFNHVRLEWLNPTPQYVLQCALRILLSSTLGCSITYDRNDRIPPLSSCSTPSALKILLIIGRGNQHLVSRTFIYYISVSRSGRQSFPDIQRSHLRWESLFLTSDLYWIACLTGQQMSLMEVLDVPACSRGALKVKRRDTVSHSLSFRARKVFELWILRIK